MTGKKNVRIHSFPFWQLLYYPDKYFANECFYRLGTFIVSCRLKIQHYSRASERIIGFCFLRSSVKSIRILHNCNYRQSFEKDRGLCRLLSGLPECCWVSERSQLVNAAPSGTPRNHPPETDKGTGRILLTARSEESPPLTAHTALPRTDFQKSPAKTEIELTGF